MIPIPTKNKDRSINYTQDHDLAKLSKYLPKENWCLIIIANEKEQDKFVELISISIDSNVGYICGIGIQQELIHDLADEVITYREVVEEGLYLPKHDIITVGDDDLEEGLWFGLYCALNDGEEIIDYLIVDFTRQQEKKIIKLVERFDDGYLPPE